MNRYAVDLDSSLRAVGLGQEVYGVPAETELFSEAPHRPLSSPREWARQAVERRERCDQEDFHCERSYLTRERRDDPPSI